ncbi:Rrp15p-domain-containing protein [Mrakia frigida]|uniref:RRP15 family protein n=1 Tax=Mrakia frigida TaxID=29902 RepID=UPI003FCBF057
MAPQPKKSKLTISSSSLASSSTSKPTKASKPARVVVEQEEEEEEEKEERLSDLDNEDESMGEEGGDFSDEDDEGEMGDEFDLGGGQREGVEDYDTDDEIERVANDKQPEKSKKTAKRKRRATSPSTFGSLLTNLLSTDASTSKHAPAADASSKKSKKSKSNSELQSSNILSLAPSIKKTISARQLETRARKVLLVTRQEKEDKGRVKDVIGGWGGREDGVGGQEWERSLRKVAQKGVVRLFNTILLSASQSETAGSNSKRLDAPEPLPDPKKKKEKDNILGRGGRNLDGGRVTKEGFEALLKGGA